MQAPRQTVENARHLRREMTPPEARLWVALKRRAQADLRFRRQHPIGPYVLDFYCAGARLAVEVDGESHGFGDRPERDNRREAWLAEQGIRTLRIPAIEVRDNLDGVVTMIVAASRGEF